MLFIRKCGYITIILCSVYYLCTKTGDQPSRDIHKGKTGNCILYMELEPKFASRAVAVCL